MTALVAFSYDALPAADADYIRETVTAVRASTRRQLEEIISVGRALHGVKLLLQHGQFAPWLITEFGWSPRTAQRYMAVAEAFEANASRVSHLPLAIIYRLATITAESRHRVISSGVNREVEIVDLIARERAKCATVKAPKSSAANASEVERKRLTAHKLALQRAARARRRARKREEINELLRAIDGASIPAVVDLVKLPTKLVRAQLRLVMQGPPR